MVSWMLWNVPRLKENKAGEGQSFCRTEKPLISLYFMKLTKRVVRRRKYRLSSENKRTGNEGVESQGILGKGQVSRVWCHLLGELTVNPTLERVIYKTPPSGLTIPGNGSEHRVIIHLVIVLPCGHHGSRLQCGNHSAICYQSHPNWQEMGRGNHTGMWRSVCLRISLFWLRWYWGIWGQISSMLRFHPEARR
jgi:hypothetical protein